MTTDTISIMGLFKNEDEAVSAINDLKKTAWSFKSIHSPIPGHKIPKALNLKESKVGWFTLAGGITGFITGFCLAIFTATRWNLIVGGKPIISWIPFFIVGFEFTILFAVFGNVAGLISQTDLPNVKPPEHYDPRCSSDHFGIVAACPASDYQALENFFITRGAKIKE